MSTMAKNKGLMTEVEAQVFLVSTCVHLVFSEFSRLCDVYYSSSSTRVVAVERSSSRRLRFSRSSSSGGLRRRFWS